MFKKTTFKEFASSDERVASNLLSSRLKFLESIGLITKTKLPENKKTNIYLLTEKGIDLAPIIMELVVWSDKYVRDYHSLMNKHDQGLDKLMVISKTQEDYREFVSKID